MSEATLTGHFLKRVRGADVRLERNLLTVYALSRHVSFAATLFSEYLEADRIKVWERLGMCVTHAVMLRDGYEQIRALQDRRAVIAVLALNW